MHELNEHSRADAIGPLVELLRGGHELGLLSEAGCPAVADPGAPLVAAAHRANIRVIPLVGPGSILLALMASGLGGQRFSFTGYLPADPEGRAARLRELERRSALDAETVLWIETPYRNQAMLQTALSVLSPGTLLTVASALTLPGESIATREVGQWRQLAPTLARTPAVFGLLAVPLSARTRPDPALPATGAPHRQDRRRPAGPVSRSGSGAAKNRRPPRP
jgi:16S rRNA (cytidine1402-2'-O)-methyltransferase